MSREPVRIGAGPVGAVAGSTSRFGAATRPPHGDGAAPDGPSQVRPPGALWVGVLCFAAALASLALSRQPGSIATLWFANAAVMACLAVRPARTWAAPAAAASLAIVAANAAWGDDPLSALGFVPANLAEILVGAALIRRAGLHLTGLRSPAAMGRLLLLGGVLPQALGAVLGAATLAWRGGASLGEVSPIWFAGSAIGAVAVLPLALLACQAGLQGTLRGLRDARLVPLTALSLGVTVLTMAHLPYPFVITLLPLLLAAVVLEQLALSALTLITALAIGLCLALGVLVPPPSASAWQEALVFLAFAGTLIPALLLGAAMCGLRDSRERAELALADLQRAHEALDQFVRIASHDMREPLNTVTQFGRLLEEDEAPRLSAPGRRYLGLMTGAAQRMRGLLDDCLAYARVKGDHALPPEPVDLSAIVLSLRDALAARIRDSGAVVEVGPLPVVQGHPSLIALLFQNLLANALKFMPPGRTPRVTVSAQRRGGRVWVSVTDNGIGIAADDLPRLFQPFQRLHTRRQYEGNGLGLSLAREIAARHQGRIEVVSTPGEGATFTVDLPLAAG